MINNLQDRNLVYRIGKIHQKLRTKLQKKLKYKVELRLLNSHHSEHRYLVLFLLDNLHQDLLQADNVWMLKLTQNGDLPDRC